MQIPLKHVIWAIDSNDLDLVKKYVSLGFNVREKALYYSCLLYTSPSPRDVEESRMPSSA